MTSTSRLALLVILYGVLFVVYVPIAPWLPSAGLDPSWVVGINQAVAQGMEFGREMVFTFGPYAAAYTGGYHPATDSMALVGGSVIAGGFALSITRLSRHASAARLVPAILVIACCVSNRDALMFAAALSAGLACLSEDEPDMDRSAAHRAAMVAALCAPLGLLPLIKGSMLVPSAAILVIVVGTFAVRRDRLRAASAIVGSAVCAVVAWLAAGQALQAFPAYITRLSPIVSGYSDAMSLWGRRSEPLIALAVSAIVFGIVAFGLRRGRTTRLATASIVALILFISFKAAFVRHDAHALIAVDALLLVGVLLTTSLRPIRGAWVAVVAAALAWGYIGERHNGGIGAIGATLQSRLSALRNGLAIRFDGNGGLRSAYVRRLDALRMEAAWPVLPGTTDVYSFDQASLIASGNHWNPRPVLQSYSVYTPALSKMNRDHLIGPNAPDNVILRVEPIDGRLPSLEDGASWPTLLAAYAPVSMLRDAMLLKRRQQPAEPLLEPIDGGTFGLGERIAVPQVDGPLFVELVARPSWLGRVLAIVFKPASLRIKLELKNGSVPEYRFIAAMGAPGFLISPSVGSANDFATLYADPQLWEERGVNAFTLSSNEEIPYSWQKSVTVRFTRLVRHRPDAVPRFIAGDPAIEDAGPVEPGWARACEGHLDALNGFSPAGQVRSVSGILRMNGWLSPDPKHGAVADDVVIAFDGEDGRRTIYRTTRVPRPDVAMHFGKPSLDASGYSARLDVSALSGQQSVRLGYRLGGVVRLCEPVSATVLPRSDGRR
jgi:hypothetical protein